MFDVNLGSLRLNVPALSTEVFRQEIEEAIDLATVAHKGQYREGSNIPYILHPMSVMCLLCEWGVKDLVTLKASLCHDVFEDTDCPVGKLELGIGVAATRVVKELTFLSDPRSMVSYPDQKAAYIESFGRMEQGIYCKSARALVVKIADRCKNTRDWIGTNPKYAPKYWRKAESLLDAFVARKEEVAELFGPYVCANIANEIEDVDRIIRRFGVQNEMVQLAMLQNGDGI